MKAIVAFSNYINLPEEQLGLVLDEYKYIAAFIIKRAVQLSLTQLWKFPVVLVYNIPLFIKWSRQ